MPHARLGLPLAYRLRCVLHAPTLYLRLVHYRTGLAAKVKHTMPAPTTTRTTTAPVAAPVAAPTVGTAGTSNVGAMVAALAAQVPTAPVAAPTAGATMYVALLVPANPKKPGSASAARFALYQHGITVAAYKAAVVAAGQPARLAAADLLWDLRHKYISLSATAPAPRA